jgi:hypothetical protein
MSRSTILSILAGCLPASLLLVSCNIRLPVPTNTVQRVQVRMTPSPAKPAQDPDVLVWLIADKYHTGMVFPYAWLLESGFVPPAGFGNPKSVTMSWGNQDAYSKVGFDNARKFLRVLFTPTPSVMEMIPVEGNVAEICPHQRIWRKLVARDRGPALATFLNGCIAMGPDGRPIVLCESSWGHGVQLKCRYPFFIPRVCNVWTLQTIEALGGEIHPWRALTANGLIRQAEKPPNDFELIWTGDCKIP